MKKISELAIVMILVVDMSSAAAYEFKEGGKEIGDGFKKLGKEVAHVSMTSGKAISMGFKEAGKKSGQAFKKMCNNISVALKGN